MKKLIEQTMFEEEAEEYATKKVGDFKPIQEDKESEWVSCCEDFQKGANFGYNKANEWHYPSKGEYPKDENKICLLYLSNMFNPITGWYKNGYWCFEDDRNDYIWQDTVIAWKEVVLPKLNTK